MTSTETDYTPGDGPVAIGTKVRYFGSHKHGLYEVVEHQDPNEHPERTPEEIREVDAYPDGVAYLIWPVGVPRKFGNRDQSVGWVKRRSFRVEERS